MVIVFWALDFMLHTMLDKHHPELVSRCLRPSRRRHVCQCQEPKLKANTMEERTITALLCAETHTHTHKLNCPMHTHAERKPLIVGVNTHTYTQPQHIHTSYPLAWRRCSLTLAAYHCGPSLSTTTLPDTMCTRACNGKIENDWYTFFCVGTFRPGKNPKGFDGTAHLHRRTHNLRHHRRNIKPIKVG